VPDISRESFHRLIQHGFHAGVNNRLQADLLPPNQVVEMKNGQVVTSTLRRRAGVSAAFTAASSISAEFQPVWLGAVTVPGKGERLVGLINIGRSSSRLSVFDGADAGPISITSPISFSEEADVVVFGDRVYILDPNGAYYWKPANVVLAQDGSGIRATPAGVSGAFFQFRGYILDGHDLVYFSKILGNEAVVETDGEEQSGQNRPEPLAWHPQQAFRLATGNGTKIIPFHNRALAIFTDRGIELLEPNNCDPLNPGMFVLTRNYGSVSKHSVAAVGEDLFFVDLEGHVRSIASTVTDEQRGVTPRAISEPISDVISRVNRQHLRAVRATVVSGGYLVGWPTGASQHANEFWFFDLRDGSWQGPWNFKDAEDGSRPLYFTGIAASRLPREAARRERVWGLAKTSADDAKLYRMFQGRQDDGSNVIFRLVTRAFDAGEPDLDKQFEAVTMRFRFLTSVADAAVSVSLRARINEGAWTSMGSKSFTPDASPTIAEAAGTPVIAESAGTPVLVGYSDQTDTWPLTGLGAGRTLQLEFTITENVSTFEILSLFAAAIVNNLTLER
jgi:hypothetical protein